MSVCLSSKEEKQSQLTLAASPPVPQPLLVAEEKESRNHSHRDTSNEH